MQAAQMRTQLPDTSKIIGLPQRPNQLVSQFSSRKRAEEQQQQTPSGQGISIDTTFSSPQWPLPNDTVVVPDFSPIIPPRSPKRLQSPPEIVRPMSDEFPIQQLSPDYAQAGSFGHLRAPSPDYGQPDEDMLSPSSFRSSRPLTNSSAISETSSLGSIPDFPVPFIPSNQQARRMPNLGPPPSARRGPSSYYTQMSYVSPIAEESDTRSDAYRSRHGSYASSNVFPTNADDFYSNDDLFSDDDSTITSERGTISPDPDDRRSLVQQSPALLRQASLGRRTKPSLMTIKSVDSLGERKAGGKSKADGTKAGAGTLGIGGPMLAPKAAMESQSSLRNMELATYGPETDYPLQDEAGQSTFAGRAGSRRPPKLDMDAVRDAEARGSLTSLPELIRRATRLAANLDRGKTASRLGLDFWEAGAPERKDTRQSGLSDMLAAFPPPGHDTPRSQISKWPSATGNSRAGATDSGMSKEKPKRRRKCCGMPLWTFITLLVVLLFIIAAAVVIPVVLVVIPNQTKSNSTAIPENQGSNSNNNNNNNNNNNGGGGSNINNGNTSNNAPARPAPTLAPGSNQCDGVIACQNGGMSILNSDRTCNCVCTNGFTGSLCANNDAIGCTTTNVAGAANNATMGTAISRLLGNGVTDLSIPLNATRILSMFSSLSLSCAAQNALITFNGLASRSETRYLQGVDLKNTLEPSRSLPVLHHRHPVQAPESVAKRQAIGAPGVPGRTSGVKAAQASATPTQPVSSNVKAVDFARAGVLYALQETGELNVAAKAQESIQSFLTSNRNGNAASGSINVGPFKMDLVQLTLVLSNGTIIRAS
jgi:hypothetical protein